MSCTAGNHGCLWRPKVDDANEDSCPSSVKSKASPEALLTIPCGNEPVLFSHTSFQMQVSRMDFFPADHKDNLHYNSSLTSFFHLQATTQFLFLIKAICMFYTDSCHSTVERMFPLVWGKTTTTTSSTGPSNRMYVIAQSAATQVYTSTCKNCTISFSFYFQYVCMQVSIWSLQ